MAHNFQRPNLPYDAESLPNDNRYKLLTRSNNRPPTDTMLDTDFNYIIDGMRLLDQDIANTVAGAIPGSDDPDNANALVTTDGAGNLSWVKVQDSNIADRSISSLKLIPQTITANEIQDGTITGDKIGALAVQAANVEDRAITTNKIAPLAVTNGKIAFDAITYHELSDRAVRTSKIDDEAVTAVKIADNAVTTNKIAANAVTAAKIANNTVTATQIANNTITATQIANKAITATQIADNTITYTQISNSFAASQSQQQSGLSSSVFVSPATQQYHPSAIGFSCTFQVVGGSINVLYSYNVTSIVRESAGAYRITYTNAMNANAPVVATLSQTGPSGVIRLPSADQLTSSSCRVVVLNTLGSAVDADRIFVMGGGY